MSAEAVVDAEVVEEGAAPAPVQEVPSTQLVRRERRSEVIKPLNADALIDSFNEYQALLPKLLDASDYQGTGTERFVKKSGWRKIATAFDLDVQMIRSEVERDEGGQPIRAEVWARAIAPSGRSMDGDGYCSVSENRFARAGGRQKLENDLRATATTRAMNRAISGLVGMGAVSAEEVDSSPANDGPPFGPDAPAYAIETCRRALAFLVNCEPDSRAVDEVLRKVANAAGGYLPNVSLTAIGLAAAAVKTAQEEVALAPGTVTPPALEGKSMEDDLAKLRDAGCICPDPYATGNADGSRPGIDDGCPIRGHGIPF
jgi:hypothetical protein